jgi:hypothetical protein
MDFVPLAPDQAMDPAYGMNLRQLCPRNPTSHTPRLKFFMVGSPLFGQKVAPEYNPILPYLQTYTYLYTIFTSLLSKVKMAGPTMQRNYWRKAESGTVTC